MKYTFTELLSFFFIYAFVGWCCEVIFAAFQQKKFVNRGFLLGPVCPVYGFGVVAVLGMLEPLKSRPVSVFILSMLVTSAVELLVGVIAEKLMHVKLWDYDGLPGNLGGYICLPFSLMWGAGCMIVVYLDHPVIYRTVSLIPGVVEVILLSVFSAAIVSDTAITVFHALKIQARMKAIDELSSALRDVSDRIGSRLSEKTLKLMEKAEDSEKLKEKRDELVAKWDELSAKYEAVAAKRNIVHDHLFNAFGNLKKGSYESAYAKIVEAKTRLKENIKKK